VYTVGTCRNNEKILSLSQKQLYFTPFIQLFRILDAELRKRDVWIIVGYSFRDIIIRTMFERALAENKKVKPLFQKEMRSVDMFG
jgi:hypothetical protein